MIITDLTVEVRDNDLNRVGQLSGADLVGATFVLRHNNVGSWAVNLPASSTMVDFLRTPGYGLVVTGPGGVILSGPTLSAKLVQSQNDLQGVWQIQGSDDSLILQERLAYPQPSNADVSTQTVANDVRSGVAETVIKGYVDANLVSGPSVRAVDFLTVAVDGARGEDVRGSARFTNLQELLYNLGQSGGLGFKVEQINAGLVFDVYEPVDRSADIRLDVDNGKLSSSEYAYSSPALTRAIVAGAGESIERLFVESVTSDSVASETVWGRRIESFVDERGTETTDQLNQAGLEALIDNGKTRVSMAVAPSDNNTMLYGTDWGLGDTITVVANDLEAVAVVYEIGLSIQTDGVYLLATVGNPTPLEFDSKLAASQSNHEDRISNLERNTTGYGVSTVFAVQGGTDGTQPTFSGPAFTASYTRFGDMVHFIYRVDFTNITSFGTGQYFMTLPYNTAHDYLFSGGALYDESTGKVYHLYGVAEPNSDVMKLWYTTSSGVGDLFTHNNPKALATEDYFFITGTYEIEV